MADTDFSPRQIWKGCFAASGIALLAISAFFVVNTGSAAIVLYALVVGIPVTFVTAAVAFPIVKRLSRGGRTGFGHAALAGAITGLVIAAVPYLIAALADPATFFSGRLNLFGPTILIGLGAICGLCARAIMGAPEGAAKGRDTQSR